MACAACNGKGFDPVCGFCNRKTREAIKKEKEELRRHRIRECWKLATIELWNEDRDEYNRLVAKAKRLESR